jgi:predicted lipoprotein with Yx(FWY)xxD motif
MSKHLSMSKHLFVAAAFAALVMSAPASAQDTATVMVSENAEYGQILTDGDGRSLYLFTTDTQGQGDTPAQVSCEGDCLAAWPPLYSDGEPQAGENVDAALLGTIEHDGQSMVTYNGWPLYYYARDEEPGQTNGQNVGGNWFLVTPAGDMVEETG